MTHASQSLEYDYFEQYPAEGATHVHEPIELAPPLQRYLEIRDELARTALARQQAEDRERELERQQLLARNACIAHGIENPDFVLRSYPQNQGEDSESATRLNLSTEAE